MPDPLPPGYIDGYLQYLIPEYAADARTKINDTFSQTYPELSAIDFASKLLGDMTLSCNTRDLLEAYPRRTHLMQYSVGNGTHGSDVAAAFYSPTLFNVTVPLWAAYQSYLTSQALTGDPNALRNRTIDPPTIEWPMVPDPNADRLGNTLNVTDDGFELIEDGVVLKNLCDVLRDALMEATTKGGY